jgi:hypothetical protein
MIFYSPLEQFEILPIFKIPFVFTNSFLFLVIGLFFVFVYFLLKNKFILTIFQKFFKKINYIFLCFSLYFCMNYFFIQKCVYIVIFFFRFLCFIINLTSVGLFIIQEIFSIFTIEQCYLMDHDHWRSDGSSNNSTNYSSSNSIVLSSSSSSSSTSSENLPKILSDRDVVTFKNNLDFCKRRLPEQELNQLAHFENLLGEFHNRVRDFRYSYNNDMNQEFLAMLRQSLSLEQFNLGVSEIIRKLGINHQIILNDYAQLNGNVIGQWSNVLNRDQHVLINSLIGIELDIITNAASLEKSIIQEIMYFYGYNNLQDTLINNNLTGMYNSYCDLGQVIDILIEQEEIQVYIPQVSSTGEISFIPRAIGGL